MFHDAAKNQAVFARVEDPAPRDLRFRPASGNFADPIPFHDRGAFHVFYLRGDSGQVPWEHIVSTDLTRWTELPTALVAGGDEHGPDGGNMFTGSVVERAGVYHLFYTGWNPRNPLGREFVLHATSADLIRWTKHPEQAFGPDGLRYAKRRDADFRDPFVFWNEDEKRWWMLLCTRLVAGDRPVTGVYTSSDLARWTPEAPLCDGYASPPECPDLFRIGDRWFLIVSPSENVTTYRTATSLRGPWSAAPGAALDTPILYAAKRQFDGRRHVLTGWLRDLEGGRDAGRFRWGGTQCLPREVFAGSAGELLSRPVPEVRLPFSQTVLDLAKTPPVLSSGWHYEAGHLVATSAETVRARFDAPGDYHLSMKLRLSRPAVFAVVFRQQATLEQGYRLELRPDRQEATLSGPGFDFPRSVPFPSDGDFQIEAFVQGSLIECFVNGGYAFSTRAYDHATGALDLVLTKGKAEVSELVIKVQKPQQLQTKSAASH